ncbi:hypothetical protein ABPG72_016144, partial [Tetrahymena utriculariae]
IGEHYSKLGKLDQCLKSYLNSYEIVNLTFKQKDHHIALSLSKLGLCYFRLDENRIGLKYLLESLEITLSFYQDNNLLIAQKLDDIGNCYQDLGDFQMAKEYLKGHTSVVHTLNKFGIFKETIGESLNNIHVNDTLLQESNLKRDDKFILEAVIEINQKYLSIKDEESRKKYQCQFYELLQQFIQLE